MSHSFRLGANYLGWGRCSFLVWAPQAARVDVHLVSPQEREIPMHRTENGYWHVLAEHVEPQTRYFYRIDGKMERPDPASRSQAEGVHQASEVIDPGFAWEDKAWCGLPLREYVLYELHIGTFTPEGTLDAIIPHLTALKE